jgi:SAM-dependent methyltransferase
MSLGHTHAWGTQPEMFGPRHEHRLELFLQETSRLDPNSRILDAAAGLGQLAVRLRGQGHRVIGLDSSLEAARHGSGLGIPMVIGDLTRLPFRSARFDAVTSGETLEHLDDDRGAVAEMNRVVRAGGRCILTVPALQILWNASDVYYQHRRRYSRSQLVELFHRGAFEVKKARFWGFPMVLLYDTVFLLPMNRRRSHHDPGSDQTLQAVARAGRSRWLVSLVKAVFSIDRVFWFVPFGPGLLLVAQKKH